MENDKIKELEKRTIELLEKTKKQSELYKTERQILYTYFVNQKDLEGWERYIEELKELIKGKV